MPRLFLEAPLAPGQTLELPSERAHYLFRVLRLGAGDTLSVFNGNGYDYGAVVSAASARNGRLEVRAVERLEHPPGLRMHLVQALIKGDKLDFALQKATELGATDIWLVSSARSEVRLHGERRARRLQHWQRVITSACEQCGRARVPELRGPHSLAEVLELLVVGCLLLLEPGAPALHAAPPGDTAVLIGPEGGFTSEERGAMLAAGASRMGLGEHTLRADTAPLAALAVLRQMWGWKLP
jgi:16S rRNA (uracil1498-N3)-methyltransferase